MEIILIAIHLIWEQVKTTYCISRQFNPLNTKRRILYLKT